MNFIELSKLVEEDRYLLTENGFQSSEENRIANTLPELKAKIFELVSGQNTRNYDKIQWVDVLLNLVNDCFNVSNMIQKSATQRRAVDITSINSTDNPNHYNISLYDSFQRNHEGKLSRLLAEFENRHPDSELSYFVSCLNEDDQSLPEARFNRKTGQLSIFGGNNRVTMAKILDRLFGLYNRRMEFNYLEYWADPDAVDRATEFFAAMIKQKAKVKAIDKNNSILLSTPNGKYEIDLTERGVNNFFGIENPEEHQKLPKGSAFIKTIQSFL
ncbi:MAG: hypothetical protein U9N57_01110 [Pseudomonadota bacterium]|nr:hypothetical protein [Pseudomonadota bacterium]